MTTTTLRLHSQAARHKSSAISAISINWKLVYACAMLASLAMLVFYIYQVNQLTRGAYAIRGYNNQISSLAGENTNLEAQFAQSDFLAGVAQQAQALGFEKTTNVAYVQIMQNSLAER